MKQKFIFVLFYIGAPLLIAARCLQQFIMIDSKTGFYNDGYTVLGIAITIACVVFAAALLLVALVSNAEENPRLTEKNVPFGIITLFCGMLMLFAAIIAFFDNNAISAVLTLLSALVLFWYGSALTANVPFSGVSALVIFVYAAVRLVGVFMKYAVEVTVTDSAFSIMTLISVMLFYFCFAKSVCKIESKANTRILTVTALWAAFFCIDSVLPNIISIFTGDSAHGVKIIDFGYVATAVFALTLVHCVSFRKKNDLPEDVAA